MKSGIKTCKKCLTCLDKALHDVLNDELIHGSKSTQEFITHTHLRRLHHEMNCKRKEI